jgi:hypothetical protein
MWKKFTDERGVAMVTALLTSMVVLSLGIVVVGISQHSESVSSYDRNRTQAVDAAEAGVDSTLQSLQTTATASLPCTVNATLPTSPAAKFYVEISYYQTYPPSGSAMTCPLSGDVDPAGALVKSTGTAVVTTAPLGVSRTMETEVRLNPIYGAFGTAIFSDTGLNLQNNLNVTGNNGNDGNVYTNGNWICDNNTLIKGSVYAQGTVEMSQGCTVAQDVWANGAVTVFNSATIQHDLTSSTSSIAMSNNTKVLHNATSGTTCAGCLSRVTATVTINHVSPAPPHLDFPTINYVAAAWQSAGYTLNNQTVCTTALPLISAGFSAKTVVRISPACALSWGNNSVINVKNDLAIITDGSIETINQTNWVSTDGQVHDLHFIVPASAATTCPGTTHDISFSNNTSFDSKLHIFVYTPCHVTYNNNNNGLGGQIFGGTVDITNLYSLAFFPIKVPGAGQVTGFNVDIAYLREITNP